MTFEYSIDLCNSITLTAALPADEIAFFPARVYSWTVSTNSSNVTLNSALSNLLATFTQLSNIIPYSFFELNLVLTFNFSYTDTVLTVITRTLVIGPIRYPYPTFSAIPTITINQRGGMNFYQLTPAASVYANGTAEISFAPWIQALGPNTTFESENEVLSIPSCSFKENTVYGFKAQVYHTDYPTCIAYSPIVNFNVPNDTFSPIIDYGSRAQVFSYPLKVSGGIAFDSNCVDSVKTGLLYNWTCTIQPTANDPFSTCSDADSLFGILSATSSLTIPSSYFSTAAALKLTLTLQRYSKTATLTTSFTISGPNVLMIDISCTYPPCTKYNSQSDLYMNASIENPPPGDVKWTFSLKPPLGFSSYGNLIFLNADTNEYFGKTLQVTATASSTGYSGSASYSIPINGPPALGLFIATPETGNALSTDFLF